MPNWWDDPELNSKDKAAPAKEPSYWDVIKDSAQRGLGDLLGMGKDAADVGNFIGNPAKAGQVFKRMVTGEQNPASAHVEQAIGPCSSNEE
jgi:hypothetical protein